MRLRALGILGVAALAAGCSSSPKPLALSIEQLGSESMARPNSAGGRTGGNGLRASDALYSRTAINITGLSLPAGAGELISDLNQNMPETLSVAYRTTCSMIVETRYDMAPADEGKVADAAAALSALSATAFTQAAAEYRVSLAAYASGRARTLGAAEARKDSTLGALATSLNVIVPATDPEGGNAVEDAFMAEAAKARAAAIAASEAYAAQLKAVQAFQRTPNLMIARWSTEEEARASGGLGSIFSGARSKRERRSGFVVLGGLRTAVLVPGDDLAEKIYRDRGEIPITAFDPQTGESFSIKGRQGSDTVFGEPLVVTYSLAARKVAYVEDRDIQLALSATLALAPEDVAQIAGGDIGRLLAKQSVKLEATLQQAQSAGAFGYLTGPARKTYWYAFWPDHQRSMAVLAEASRLEGYSMIYSNRTSLERRGRQVERPYFVKEGQAIYWDADRYPCMRLDRTKPTRAFFTTTVENAPIFADAPDIGSELHGEAKEPRQPPAPPPPPPPPPPPRL